MNLIEAERYGVPVGAVLTVKDRQAWLERTFPGHALRVAELRDQA